MGDILLALIQGLLILLDPQVLSLMMVGIVVGMFFGLVPGLGGLAGLGLLLPFSFGMEPEQAFAFLLGLATVITQTDTIPAVLIGVPGTAQAQATYLDGYPMAKRGEAGRALSASYMASILGTLVAMVLFIAMLPFVRAAIREFASPEFFMLTVWGLVMVGSLAGTSLLRGLVIVGFGLLLASVGTAINADFPRYDFGIPYLEGGLPLVPVVIGLFAIPEVVDMMIRRRSIADRVDAKGGLYAGIWDNFREWKLVIKAGTVGAACGAIPGLGGIVAEWFGYAIAVQSAKDASMFGKGDVRGVIAPEAATAGQSPGALLPTIAFGIPGSAGMALILGAFMIVGLVPGGEMINEKLPLTFMMVWVIFFGKIIAALIALALQNYMVKICYVRPTILAPIILCTMAVGATMSNQDFADIMVFGVFGVIGYFFKHADWPRVPVIIGLVLGQLSENYLFISINRYGLDWLWERPIVIVIEVIVVLTVAMPLYRGYFAKRREAGTAPKIELGEGE